MKAVVFTLGCKVNEYESRALSAGLEALGYEVSEKLGYADLYLLNTCAVTREAEAKSRQLVARVRRLNPAARILVCGCAAEKDAAAFSKLGVRLVTGAKRKDRILGLLDQSGCAIAREDVFETLPAPKRFAARAYVKIQDGCNRFCSYCVIPYLRGRSRSKPFAACVEEVLSCGAEEVVLTGIDLSSYRDEGKGLSDLVAALGKSKARIRLGSLEVSAVDDALLAACRSLPAFAPQFHLSLQSGSDAVLRAMNRHYTRADALAACKAIYAAFPHAAITADLIAGYPTETEADFSETLSLIAEAGLARVHCFAFSPREGTQAAKLADLPAGEKRERLHRLLAAAQRAQADYLSRQIGRTFTMLAEEEVDGYTVGYTENYVRAYLPGKAEGMVPITAKQIRRDGILAERR